MKNGPCSLRSDVPIMLKDCAVELAPVRITIFNQSLASSWVPGCLKAAKVPVPEKPNVAGLNNYRPVAPTTIVAKCVEKLVMKRIKASILPSLDHNQFAYRKNRSTEDAISIVLHTLLEHLEHRNTYGRLLFVDFSSAFNTIQATQQITQTRPDQHIMQLDFGLSNTPHTSCQDWQARLPHPALEHRGPSGLRA